MDKKNTYFVLSLKEVTKTKCNLQSYLQGCHKVRKSQGKQKRQKSGNLI